MKKNNFFDRYLYVYKNYKIKRLFAKMTQYSKLNTKLIHDFFGTFICFIHPKKFGLFTKMQFFFNFIFIKYLQYCHCHKYTNHHEQLI